MPRDCATEGHVLVDDDPECLACGRTLTPGDPVGQHVRTTTRNLGELANPQDRASIYEYGRGGTAPT